MKKLFLFALAACAISPMMAADSGVVATSQDDVVWTTETNDPTATDYSSNDLFHDAYFKVSWDKEKLKYPENDFAEGESDWGVSLDWGGMTNFNSKPLFRMVNIGLDVHFAAAYASYKDGFCVPNKGTNVQPTPATRADSEEGNMKYHHGSVGIGIGPAVSVAPFAFMDNTIVRKLTCKAFYHFTPSYSAMIYKDESGDSQVKGGFCLYQSFGFEVAFDRLGVGIEKVNGSAKYNDVDLDELKNGYSSSSADKKDKTKLKIDASSFRLFVTYKF